MSPLSEASAPARAELVSLGRRYFQLGWLFATAGNLSARVTDRVVVTASGKHKGDLTPTDFVEVAMDGTLLTTGSVDMRPSAETNIHLALYRNRPTARFCLHVHTVASTLIRPDAPSASPEVIPTRTFAGVEMVKALNLWHEHAVANLPIFPNHHDVARIASDIERYYAHHPDADVPALVVSGHGITAWGPDAATANRHVEATEFLCQLAGTRG